MPPERKQVFMLAPADLKPGSVSPEGKVVRRATLSATSKAIVVHVTFEDNTSTAFMWPSGSGWTVDGRTAP